MEAITEFLIDWGYWGLFLLGVHRRERPAVQLRSGDGGARRHGLDPQGCIAAAALGNTLGGMTCY